MNRTWECFSMIVMFALLLFLFLKCYPKDFVPVKIVHEITTPEKIIQKVESPMKYNHDVISEARLKIDKAYEFYKMYKAYEDFGIISIEQGGDPMKIIVASTWRAGSSFLSGIIESAAPNFYSYEPDARMFTKRLKSPKDNLLALKKIHSMLNCDYSAVQNYSKFARNHHDAYSQHTMTRYCDDDLCFNNMFVSKLCKMFPFQTLRVMRFELSSLRDYFMKASSNVHIVYLARDPRAIMSSRIFVRDCQITPECMDPKTLCDDMLRDFITAREFHQMYPHNFTVLRFEDLLKSLSKEVPSLLRTLKMVMTHDVVSYLNQHTKQHDIDTFSVYRTTRTVPFKWKNILTFEYVMELQRICAPALAVWGYSLIKTEKQLNSKVKPIVPFDPYGDPTTEAEYLRK